MNNEEFEKELKEIEKVVNELRIKFLESKADKKPYEVEVPKDIENYYNSNQCGDMDLVGSVSYEWDYVRLYQRGLAFKTEEEARQYDKERILLFKLHKWAEEYNGGWTPDWNESESKYFVEYDSSCGSLNFDSYCMINTFSKLPYFKSEEIAKQFIKEFGEEIKEVLL